MKRIVFIIAGILIAWSIFGLRDTSQRSPKEPIPQATQTPTLAPAKSVTVDGISVGYAFIVASPSQISLLPNFNQPVNSRQLMDGHSCQSGINGGFYDTDGQPLGLFVAGQIASKAIRSSLLNGFFTINAGTPSISQTPPEGNVRLGLQTGPRLLEDGSALPLRILRDERARRMVAAISSVNDVVFIALFSPDSVFDGPLLGDTPAIIRAISQQENINLVQAINLDGGSASAFYNQTVSLEELTPVGSMFCVKSDTGSTIE